MKSSSTLSWSNNGVWGIAAVAACSVTAVIAFTTVRCHMSGSGSPSSTFLKLCTRNPISQRLWWSSTANQSSITHHNIKKSRSRSRNFPLKSNSNVDDDIVDDDIHHDGNETSTDPQQQLKRSRFDTIEDTMISDGGSLRVHPIGVVRSVYRLCVGTPRQGMLVPHGRARIELFNIHDDRTGVAAAASVDGLQHYSHIWIVFVFHLNTMGKRTHSKITPPALGGRKVGVLASRSPHRLNPIGITLAKLDAIRTIPQARTVDGRKKGAMTVLDISGMDLVDGTPVIDIKPYVPTYDSVPMGECHVPDWVSDGLATSRPVQFTEKADNDIRNIIIDNPKALEFYGSDDTTSSSIQESYENVKACIEEVLTIDVRSRHQTNKARQGQSRAERSDRIQQFISTTNTTNSNIPSDESSESICSQQIDNLLISFIIKETTSVEREESFGSGAEDFVIVQSVSVIEHDK